MSDVSTDLTLVWLSVLDLVPGSLGLFGPKTWGLQACKYLIWLVVHTYFIHLINKTYKGISFIYIGVFICLFRYLRGVGGKSELWLIASWLLLPQQLIFNEFGTFLVARLTPGFRRLACTSFPIDAPCVATPKNKKYFRKSLLFD